MSLSPAIFNCVDLKPHCHRILGDIGPGVRTALAQRLQVPQQTQEKGESNQMTFEEPDHHQELLALLAKHNIPSDAAVKLTTEKWNSMNEPDRFSMILLVPRQAEVEAIIRASSICGCYYCMKTFKPDEITEWTAADKKGDSDGVCPKCGIDAVIGSAAGYPIEQWLLRRLCCHWFSATDEGGAMLSERDFMMRRLSTSEYPTADIDNEDAKPWKL